MRIRLHVIATAALVLGLEKPIVIAAGPQEQLEEGLRLAERYKVPGLEDRRFTHRDLWAALGPYLDSSLLTVDEIGKSIQERVLRAVTFGTGDTRVLLWSQMHGDESTATMALADIIRFFVDGGGDPLRERIRNSLSVTMVPMLNPDGAEVFQRENAIGVDINRDARRRATPEARALKALRDRLSPQFGFNLHDQWARTLAGQGGAQVGIALLAPATDEARGYDPTRARARLIAAGIAEVLSHEMGPHLAKYDDEFTPRAFGDLMQVWGTSTVLIESGALAGDSEKQRLRALNVTALLSAFDAIATGSYREADPDIYERLPFNERIDHDILLRGGRLVDGKGKSFEVDVGLYYEDPLKKEGLRLSEMGDLRDEQALEVLDVSNHYVRVMLTADRGGTARLGPDAPVSSVTVHRGLEGDSEIVHRFGDVVR